MNENYIDENEDIILNNKKNKDSLVIKKIENLDINNNELTDENI